MKKTIRRMWARWRLRRICKALGIEPWPEVKAYVLDKKDHVFSSGRRSGKTMAVILDTLVYKRVQPAMAACDGACQFCRDPDFGRSRYADRWYIQQLKEAARTCEASGIEVVRG